MLKADLHIHTKYSGDSNLDPDDLIKIAKKKGLKVIGVVDHNTLKGGIEVKKIAKDIVVFAGEEIKTNNGEIIGFDIEEEISNHMSLVETCKAIKEQCGWIMVPHPFDRLRSGVQERISNIIKYIDVIEGFNARAIFDSFNKRAQAFAAKNNIPWIANSDAHFGYEIASAYTLINSNLNKNNILKAIKNNEIKSIAMSSPIKPHVMTFIEKMKKHL